MLKAQCHHYTVISKYDKHFLSVIIIHHRIGRVVINIDMYSKYMKGLKWRNELWDNINIIFGEIRKRTLNWITVYSIPAVTNVIIIILQLLARYSCHYCISLHLPYPSFVSVHEGYHNLKGNQLNIIMVTTIFTSTKNVL